MLLNYRRRVVQDIALAATRAAGGGDDSERKLLTNRSEKALVLSLMRISVRTSRVCNLLAAARIVGQVRNRRHEPVLLWQTRDGLIEKLRDDRALLAKHAKLDSVD